MPSWTPEDSTAQVRRLACTPATNRLARLTKSLKGCFSGISHSSLIVMYLQEEKKVFRRAVHNDQNPWWASRQVITLAALRQHGTPPCSAQWRGAMGGWAPGLQVWGPGRGRPLALPKNTGRLTQGEHPGSHYPSQNSLVEIGEEIDSECVLLIQLVAISIFYSIQGMGRRCIFQENIPEGRMRAFWSCYKNPLCDS